METLAEPASPDSGRGVVLIVEDDQDLRDILAMLLEAAGHAVASVGTTAAARAWLAANPAPGLVVLDVELPDGDGRNILEALRATPTTAAIPALMLTGGSLPPLAPPVEVLRKPANLDDLLAIVRRHCGMGRA